MLALALWLLTATSPYEALMARAEAAYRAVELREAATLYRRAARAADGSEARAVALLWSALSVGQAGDLDEARAGFDEALRVSCTDTLPTRVSPKVDEVFRAAHTAARCDRAPPTTVTDVPPPEVVTRPPATATETRTTTPTTTPSPAAPPAQPDLSLPLAVVGGGGVLAALGLVVGAKGGLDVMTAADPQTPQIEARALLDQGNVALAIGGIIGVAGAIVAGVGAALALGTPEEEHDD